MNRIEKILVAIDFSDTTRDLIELVIKFHHTFSPRFILLHVIPLDILDHLKKSSSLDREHAVEFVKKEVTPLWKKVEEELPASVDFQKEFREGIPHKAIARCAEELECDLILMGCHLRPKVQEIFVGQTPKSILDATHIPVVLVKSKK